MREVGATGIGALKGATVVVVAEEDWVGAGIELCASSCAGVAFLLFELGESREAHVQKTGRPQMHQRQWQ